MCILYFVSPKVGVINHVVGLKFIQISKVGHNLRAFGCVTSILI